MPNFIPKSLGGMVAAIALAGAVTLVDSTTTFAQTPLGIYSGGGTTAEFVLRDLFNCWGSGSNAAPMLGTTSCAGGTNSIDPDAGEVLYAPGGSGGGQNAYLADNPALLGTPGSANPPYTSGDYPAYPFPSLTFGASDFPLTAAQIGTFNAAALGPALQLPVLVTSVVIPFNQTGLTIVNAPPPQGSSGLMLSRNNLCGIFSGAITDWADARLGADNGGTPLSATSLPIKLVYRHEGSGITLLLSNALITQCGGSSYPMPTAWGAASTIYFAHNAATLPANFYDEQTLTSGETGGDGIADAVAATTGAISYDSPDYALPYGVTGHTASPTANLQNQHSVSAGGAPVFTPPSQAGTAAIMASATPPAANSSAAAWGSAGIVANPTGMTAYPIGGFSWLLPYSCYHEVATLDALITGTVGLYKFIWGTGTDATTVSAILETHGFAPLPSAWLTAANHAAFRDTGTKIRRSGGANAAFCSSGA